MSESLQGLDNYKNYSFVGMSPNLWSGQWMNRQQILSRIGLHTATAYSQGLKQSWQIEKKQLFSLPFGSAERDNNVVVDTPPSLWFRADAIDNLMLRIYGKRLGKYFKSGTKRVLYLFHPSFYPYCKSVKHDILIYHPYDDFAKQGILGEKQTEYEKWLVQNADLTLTPSEGVTESLANRYHRSDIKTVHNGVDFEAFSDQTNVVDDPLIDGVEGKKIAYIGSLNVKLDFRVLHHLSDKISDANLFLLGPVGQMGEKQNDFDLLLKKSNVHLIGRKGHQELPAYMRKMDCLLMCYDTSDELWAKHAYPLKMNEYFATKTPVVSCPLPSVPGVDSLLNQAASPDEWVEQVRVALSDNYTKVDAAYEYASQQDWMMRVEQILSYLENL